MFCFDGDAEDLEVQFAQVLHENNMLRIKLRRLGGGGSSSLFSGPPLTKTPPASLFWGLQPPVHQPPAASHRSTSRRPTSHRPLATGPPATAPPATGPSVSPVVGPALVPSQVQPPVQPSVQPLVPSAPAFSCQQHFSYREISRRWSRQATEKYRVIENR